MTYRVSQVEGLADAVLERILFHNLLLHLHRFADQLLQTVVIDGLHIKAHQLAPVADAADETVFQHLRIARKDVLMVKCTKELAIDEHCLRRTEGTNLVLQSVEVDTGLSPHRCIDHRKERSRYINIRYAPLESGSRKTSKVGHHATSQVQQQRAAGRSLVAEAVPYIGKCLQILVNVARTDADGDGFLQAVQLGDDRPAQPLGMLVRQDEQLVERLFRQ